MATEPVLAAFDFAVVQNHGSVRSRVLADYWTLTKPEVNLLIAMATAVSFCLGYPKAPTQFAWMMLLHTVLGTVLVASGAGTLNQLIERQFDARMRRTARRPIVAGRISPTSALVFGTALSLAGSLYLALAVCPAASLLALTTLAAYLLLYTPLKRRTPLCMLVGAFPGAMPVLIGYVAAAGRLSLQAWLLYAVLFLWQFPHFMAIAWMYREDYARAWYLVLPRGKESGRFMTWQAVVPSLALLPVTLSPRLVSHTSLSYTVVAFLVSSAFVYLAVRMALLRSNTAARRLLLGSIIYLPLMFVLVFVAERLP